MSEDPQGSESDKRDHKDWLEEAQEALERTGEALRAAWDATRDSRASALESAKQASRQLGEAIDRGVDAARARWATESEPETEATGSSGGAAEEE